MTVGQDDMRPGRQEYRKTGGHEDMRTGGQEEKEEKENVRTIDQKDKRTG